MIRKNCLTRSIDIQRVKCTGVSFADPFMRLITVPNDLLFSRFAIAAGRSVGNAVLRNRAKRRLRSCLDEFSKMINPGWDVIIYGRRRLIEAKYGEIRLAMIETMQKANLLTPDV